MDIRNEKAKEKFMTAMVQGSKYPDVTRLVMEAFFESDRAVGHFTKAIKEKAGNEALRSQLLALGILDTPEKKVGGIRLMVGQRLDRLADWVREDEEELDEEELLPLSRVFSWRELEQLEDQDLLNVSFGNPAWKLSFKCVGVRRGCLVFIQDGGITDGFMYDHVPSEPVCWADCAVREEIEHVIMPAVPAELLDKIKSLKISQYVKKDGKLVRKVTYDKFWVPSVKDSCGIDTIFRSRAGTRHNPDPCHFLARVDGLIQPIYADDVAPLALGFMVPLEEEE